MILFSDFDDTLCTHGDEATYAKNLAAAQRFRKAGHKFCLATGRTGSGLACSFPDYTDYCDYAVLENGAVCINRQHDIVFQQTIKSKVVEQILDILSEAECKSEFAYAFYGNMGEYQNPPESITQFRCWVDSIETAKHIAQNLTKKFSNEVKVFPIQGNEELASSIDWIQGEFPAYLEIVSAKAGKNVAIAECAKDEERIITIGDGINDIDMIKAFEGYTVANAKPEVLAILPFDRVVPNVATLIDKLLAE